VDAAVLSWPPKLGNCQQFASFWMILVDIESKEWWPETAFVSK
jgi:hypothetical protein